MRRILLAALLLAASDGARAGGQAPEDETLRLAIEIAMAGGLGFELPNGWRYDYEPRYGACGRLPNGSCLPVADDMPFEEEGRYEPVWALTSRSANHTAFFRDSAAANPKITIAYAKPGTGGREVVMVAPQPFTALEMAAYVIGHEVHGHIVQGLGAGSDDELLANYYGLEAVRALRRGPPGLTVAER